MNARTYVFSAVALLLPAMAFAGQPLETESARLAKAGTGELEMTYEYQTSSEGKEISAPMAVEYGLSDRLEVMVEPVFYTAIRPKTGRKATGLGDTEVTLTWLASQETDKLPAIALAGEVKLPTAKDSMIGTGKTDYSATAIASKRFGKLDTHFNLT